MGNGRLIAGSILPLSLALACFLPYLRGSEEESSATADAARQTHALEKNLLASDNALKAVKAFPVQGEDSLFVAVSTLQNPTCDRLECVKYRDGKILWKLRPPDTDAPRESFLLGATGFLHKQFSGPLIEVYGDNILGNGNYYLYELRQKEWRLLATTFAVDTHADKQILRGGKLVASYEDVNRDGRIDVVLTGLVDLLDPETEDVKITASGACRKVLLWNPARAVFEEDPARAEGFETYQE